MPDARRTWLALAALTLVGAALRLPFLGLQSLWYDETFTLAIVERDSLGALWDHVRETESTPPLYYALTWLWTQVAGSTEDASLRALAAVAGVLCVPASYLAVRRLCGAGIGLAVAALTAVSPVLVAYSLNARAYTLLVLLACLSLWALGEALERGGGRWLGLWALLAAACLWTHYYAGFLIVAEFAILLWRLPQARLRVAAAGVGVAVLFAPLLTLLTEQRDERASHIDRLPLDERVEQAVRQLAAAPNPPSRVLEWLAVALAAGGLVAGAYLARRRTGAALLGAIAAFAVGAPLALAVTGVDDHFFMRNLLVAWAALTAIIALGLTRARGVPLAAALAVGAALAIWTHADWRHQNSDWEGAVAALGTDADDVPVVVLPGLNHPVPNAYLRRPVQTAPFETQRVWVLVEPGRAGQSELEEQPDLPRSVPPGFTPSRTRRHHGFRLIEYRSPVPAGVSAGEFGTDQIGQPAVLLGPR